MDYRAYMAEAIVEAGLAAAAGEVPVGAVLTLDEQIIARAHNLTEWQQNPLAHAELLAIKQAQRLLGQKYLTDCTLFVSMEPCPMCAGAIILARLGRVVYGCPDSRFGACGSVFNLAEHKMSPHKPQLVGGICEEECRALLQDFFQRRRTVIK